MKRCGRCEHWLPPEAFTPNRSRRDGLQAFCQECQRAYMRAHYEANRAYYLAKARRSNAKAHHVFRERLWELKSAPCQDCGVQYPPWVMQFDHVRGDKLFNVSSTPSKSLDAMLREAAKCEVVCSNCHQQRTWRRSARP